MATRKFTLKTIKDMVKSGAAQDIDKMKNPPKPRDLECLGLSMGIYGMNGGLYMHYKTKKLYAITARNSTLFEYGY